MKSNTKNIRLLVVEDHDLVRSGLVTLLENEEDIEIVGEARNGIEAIGKVHSLVPDVVLMDLKLPMIDGFEATATIAREFPRVRVLAVTHLEHEAYIRRMIQMGGSGFVLKSRAIEDLKEAIRVVHRGGRFISPPFADTIDFSTAAMEPSLGEQDVLLTQREREVLRLVASGKTTTQIAAELRISERTVEFYEANLNEKVGVTDRQGLVQYARQRNPLSTDS